MSKTYGTLYQNRYRELKVLRNFEKEHAECRYGDDMIALYRCYANAIDMTSETNKALFKEIKMHYETMNGVKPSDATIKGWVIGRTSIPPIHTLSLIASFFNTNIGYLLGLHDCINMPNTSINPVIDDATIATWEKTYRESHYGLSICHKGTGIKKTWFQMLLDPGARKIPSHESVPFIRLNKALGFSLDYLLGLSPYPYWETYLFLTVKANLSKVLDNSKYLICNIKEKEYMSLKAYDKICENYNESPDQNPLPQSIYTLIKLSDDGRYINIMDGYKGTIEQIPS